MATMHSPLPGSASNPPTPPTAYPVFPRLHGSSPSISRNASTSSSRSTNTTSSTSSLVAVPIRPPPKETSTAATPIAQLPSRAESEDEARGSYASPQGTYGGRGFMRNGPRSRQGTLPLPIITTNSLPNRAASTPLPEQNAANLSPETPRARYRFDEEGIQSTLAQREPSSPKSLKTPQSPTFDKKPRTLSVGESREVSRERRQSQMSNRSGKVRESPRDYVFGEELGRGSYSTVVQACKAANSASPTSPRAPKQYAIKIINQAHLIQEQKTKYAMIEKDALIRLNTPRLAVKGHSRGMSSSSSVGMPSVSRVVRSTNSGSSLNGLSAPTSRRGSTTEKIAITIGPSSDGGSSSSSAPLSPTYGSFAGRRPSRSADPPEVVVERSEDGDHQPIVKSTPPSPVKEEDVVTPPRKSRNTENITLNSPDTRDRSTERTPGPQSRRASAAPSERSVKSGRSAKSGITVAHPGIIRLYSTFNDATSLYFVLDLASNGELLTYLRKYGSLDLNSARYYAAQLIDTIEFMQERGVIHRDLKPENILLDEDMRIRVTDFGSAKILHKDQKDGNDAHDTTQKRSFVGSADFVSPEVLRNEAAVFASDVWAFGCVLFQLLVGKPPFRGATDYLTFQKILKREFEYPEGFDEDAKTLIDGILDLDPAARPSPSTIKSDPFFSSIDWSNLWQMPAPIMSTGLTKPVATLANVEHDSDLWAVFEDEVSDGGFPYDEEEPQDTDHPQSSPAVHPIPPSHEHRTSPWYDDQAAANAVASVDDLTPPKQPWTATEPRKSRGWSRGSHRTSSSSSASRTGLSGFLETMGIQAGSSSRTSRTSVRSDEARPLSRGSEKISPVESQPPQAMRLGLPTGLAKPQDDKWSSLLLSNENVTFTSPIYLKNTALPSFMSPASKRRQLILTDFPRLITVKEERRPSSSASRIASAEGEGSGNSTPHLSVKSECVFVVHPSARTAASGASRESTPGAPGTPTPENGQAGGAARVVDIQEKGTRGFVVQTSGQSHNYVAETAELRAEWMQAFKRVSESA